MTGQDFNSFPPLPTAAPCPFCDGKDTELINPFGGQLSVAQYWCRHCRTGFDFMKWEERDPPDAPPRGDR